MNKKMRTFLLIFSSIAVVACASIVLREQQVPQNEDINTTKIEQPLLEASEIIKNDKDFYQVSVKKNTKGMDVSKGNTMKTLVDQIKRLLGMKVADISKLDKTMHTLLMDKKIPRIDKINAIWGMLQEIGFASEQSQYLLDALSTLLPIELTKDLINVYADVKDPSMKIKLIGVLAESTSILNPEVQDKERLNFVVEKIQEIQLFLKEDVLKESDTHVLEEGLYAYASVSDADDIQELITALGKTENGSSIPPEVFHSVLTEAAMTTPEAQADMLPLLLENASVADAKQKEHFTEMMLDGINAGVLTQKSQKELSTYLQAQEPTLDVKKVATTETTSQYYAWAEGMSKLQEGGSSLKNIVLENENPLKVSSILVYADDHTVQQIKESPNVERVYTRLEVALEDDSSSEQTKNMVKTAMGRLKEDISLNNQTQKESK